MHLATLLEDGWQLDDGEERHLASPDSFDLPPVEARSSLRPGQIVKLIFRIDLEDEHQVRSQEVERMWVVVQAPLCEGKYIGALDNDPYCTVGIRSGMKVVFEPRHVIQVHSGPV